MKECGNRVKCCNLIDCRKCQEWDFTNEELDLISHAINNLIINGDNPILMRHYLDLYDKLQEIMKRKWSK